MTDEPLLLSQDVFLTSAEDLPEGLRARIACCPGSFVLSRCGSRAPSSLIDSHSAELLREFIAPATIEGAIRHYSRAHGRDPQTTLTEAWPLLDWAIRTGCLAQARLAESRPTGPSLVPGAHVGEVDVVRCIVHLEDAEVYRAKSVGGQSVALKILRRGAGAQARSSLAREASILRHLNGCVSPRLFQADTFENRFYLTTEWCEGVAPTIVAAELRHRRHRSALLRLCCSILDSYARLHEAGVVHADVHPSNLLISTRDTACKVLDFGVSLWPDADTLYGHPPRGIAEYYLEPEFARACLESAGPVHASFAGEQYALATLLYVLITGAHYRDFSLRRDEALRQISTEPPVSFTERGIPAWPDVEQVLSRALRKDPSDRFSSVAEFADRIREASIPEELRAPMLSGLGEPESQLPNGTLTEFGPDGSLFRAGLLRCPTASVADGAGGIAYALYRIGCIRADARLLSWADLWSNKAWNAAATSGAFHTPDRVGPISLYHTLTGVECVRALVGQAIEISTLRDDALEAFASSRNVPCGNLDLALGRSGLLLGASRLLDAIPQSGVLGSLGAILQSGILDELDVLGPISECLELPYLGIAHGWAGVLYATLSWCRSAGLCVPNPVLDRLDQLARCAEPCHHAVRWRRRFAGPPHERGFDYLPGWCNGTAGFIHLWTLAWRLCREESHLRLAEGAAWYTWENAEGAADLCCGLIGQAYGLLNLYKLTGEPEWLNRARVLADRATAGASPPNCFGGLYHGSLGVALLAADLASPDMSAMPLFEDEGWAVMGE